MRCDAGGRVGRIAIADTNLFHSAMADIDDLFNGVSGSASGASPSPRRAKASAESRRETRVRANWPARVLLPNGAVQALWVYDLAESGVGFAASAALPANQVLTFAIAVPDLNGSSAVIPITGTVRVAHMTIRGPEVHCGGPWITISREARDLLEGWIRHLRKR
jgi:hypothetical protein